MSCFSCGQGFSNDVNILLRGYKEQYNKFGIIRYFYRTKTNGEIYVCRQSSFSTIYEEYIKPNLQEGAEYSNISEYK